MSKSTSFILITFVQLLVLCALYLHADRSAFQFRERELPAGRELVRVLGLTDFAIWTEARYTRHPSQADFFAPFQDFPSSLEHFPAGSVLAPALPPATGPED
jgi:hypothetical protein